MRIELTALAWEARVLPLYDARNVAHSNAFMIRQQFNITSISQIIAFPIIQNNVQK